MIKLKDSRSGAILVGIVVIAAVLFTVLPREMFALGWHLFNGRTAHLDDHHGKKYDVTIPVLWWPQMDDAHSFLLIADVPARVRAPLGRADRSVIIISADHSPYSTSEKIQWRARLARMTVTEAANLRVAGQELRCFELRSTALPPNQQTVELECGQLSDENGISANFPGDRSRLPAFYAFLRNIKSAD